MVPSKTRLREHVWALLEEHGVALFPGTRGRIPNFAGAERAAELLATNEVWQEAKALKCNPDLPQRPVREQALRQGKKVYMAVPRLRQERCFLLLDPRRLKANQLRQASTIKGAFALGRPVRLEDVEPIDLVVAGSVVVNRQGARVGKGGGYSDLEFALGREQGFIRDSTPVVTTVHPLQIVDEEIPMLAHDIPLDLIVTPGEIIEVISRYPKPQGIYPELLDEEKIAGIPVLQRLLSARVSNREKRERQKAP